MKKVVLDKDACSVSLEDVQASNVYIAYFGYSCFKLHKTYGSNTMWAFVSLSTSTYHANGDFSSIKDAISAAIHQGATVFEIREKRDFIECLKAHE